MLRASFDGKALLTNLGLWNPVCKNQELFESVKECKATIRHTSNIDFKMENLIRKLSALRQSWCTLDSMIDHMNGQTTHIDDFIAELFPKKDSKKGETMFNNRKSGIRARIEREQRLTGEGNGLNPTYATNWRIYNAIQGYFQHDSSRNGSTTDIERILSSNSGDTVKAFNLLSV